MRKDVTNADLMQAIIDLTVTQKEFSEEQRKTNEKIDQLDAKINRIDKKIAVLSQNLFETQTDVKELQSAK